MIRTIISCIFLLGFTSQALGLTTVYLGLASNFKDVSTSTSNPFGNYFRDGISLALEKATDRLKNAGLAVAIKEFDYGIDAMRAASVAQEAAESNVIAVIGYNWSSHALIAAPIHQKRRLPMISPSATANRLSEMGAFIHTTSYSNSFMALTLAIVAKNRLKAKKAGIVLTADCAYCRDLAESFKKYFEMNGGNISVSIDVLGTDSDYNAAAITVKNANPDVILIPNQELVSARIVSTFLRAGVRKPFIGGDGWGDVGQQFFQILGEVPHEGYSVSHWHPDLTDKRSIEFKFDYEKRFKKTPNDTSVLAFDATNFFVEALVTAKSIDRMGIETALNNIQSLNGVTGRFLFKPNVAPKKSILLLKNGKSKFEISDRIDPKLELKK